jgi:hypothetical protein
MFCDDIWDIGTFGNIGRLKWQPTLGNYQELSENCFGF